MSHENVELARKGLEALNRGDRATVERLIAPDVEWHSLAGPILGLGTIRGREAMLKFLWQDLPASIEGFRASEAEVTDLATIGSWSWRGSGAADEAATSRLTNGSPACTKFGMGWW